MVDKLCKADTIAKVQCKVKSFAGALKIALANDKKHKVNLSSEDKALRISTATGSADVPVSEVEEFNFKYNGEQVGVFINSLKGIEEASISFAEVGIMTWNLSAEFEYTSKGETVTSNVKIMSVFTPVND